MSVPDYTDSRLAALLARMLNSPPAAEDRYLVYLVCLVCLVKQAQLDEQDKPDRPDEPERPHTKWTAFLSILRECAPAE